MPQFDDPALMRISQNCKLLYHGYEERVDYTVEVKYHRSSCEYYSKATQKYNDCDCPIANEKRSRNVKRPGYLEQLQQFAQNKDTDRNPKAERGAPRVKVAGRPPGDMAGFFAVDELTCDIVNVVDRALDEVGRDRTWACGPVTQVLAGLATQVSYFAHSRPDVLRDVDKAAARWVSTARSTLRISTSDSFFDSVVCGNCGGALSTPWGNQDGADVRCVGTPSDGPCGETYPVSEWLRLYEQRERGRS